MIGPEVKVPDVTEPVVGFRTFHLKKTSQHNYALASPHTGDIWPTAKQTARCNNTISSDVVVLDGIKPRQHQAPQKDCGCGIYVYFDPKNVAQRKPDPYGFSSLSLGLMGGDHSRVPAVITLTGRVEVHSRGMRGQHGEVRALGTYDWLHPDEKAALQELATAWDIPLVPQEQLAKIAHEFGTPLDESLRPEGVADPAPPAPSTASMVKPSAAWGTSLTIPMGGSSGTWAVESVPAPRLSRKAQFLNWVPAGLNGAVCALNLTMFAVVGNPINAASAGVSAVFCGWYWRTKRAI